MREMQGDLLILGISGKMGPSLARRARRACEAAGVTRRILGVARFSTPGLREELERAGIETIATDLLEPGALEALPDAANVVFMAARKFGSTGAEYQTWAMNSYLPGLVADRYRDARIVAFSSGNVYPLTPVMEGGSTERSPVGPVGEYAMSALGRERIFEHQSREFGAPVTLLRLNYATELRYGVLYDIGIHVFQRQPVDLAMGNVNVIWQGDANSACLRAFRYAQSPPFVINLTGPETLSVRWAARRFGEHFGIEPRFEGSESSTALLNNAALAMRLFGYPTVSVDEMIEWIATWIGMGGRSLDKPTHFETRDGKF
jgi:nucleoside-diphosphate-sugar epimerase